MEPAAWAENIPFGETRDYVKKKGAVQHRLLQRLLGGKPTSLKAHWARRRATRRTRAGIGQRSAVNKPKRVVVLGGTGFVGRSVCERLVAHGGGAGIRITVPTRRLAHAKSVQFLPTVDPSSATCTTTRNWRRAWQARMRWST